MATDFQSILYQRGEIAVADARPEAVDARRDLHLDQIFAAAVSGKEQYDLTGVFHRPLDDPDDIRYRQEAMQDLEDPVLLARIAAFAAAMARMRSHLQAAAEGQYPLHNQGWFLEAVAVYGAAVRRLAADLAELPLRSRGFRRLRDYLGSLIAAPPFAAVASDTQAVQAGLRTVRYCLVIRGPSITVRRYDGEADYSSEIEEAFAKFRQGEVSDDHARFPDRSGAGHVEAQIVELVARLYPEEFRRLHEFCERHQDFADAVVVRFEREVQFYIAYLQFIERLRRCGLHFCYPEIGRDTKAEHAENVFDLALAARLASESAVPVVNDFRLDGRERALVVSGPNQGGKTTLARTIGQMHYLASLGCPVPGSRAHLYLCDRIFTHFEREERVADLRGKLQDDVLRIHSILAAATPDSLIILNEIFSSTALGDAVFLASEIMRQVLARDCLCVCVTFLDELARLGDGVVSMVSTVVPDNPAQRTFKIVRQPADGRAYAMAIAEKYGLSYRSLRQRLAS